MEDNKKKSSIILIVAGLAVILVLAILMAVIVPRLNKGTNVKGLNEIKEKLNIDIKQPENASDLTYDIVNNSIAKVAYSKVLPDGKIMHFVMRSSYSTEEDLATFTSDPQFSDSPIFMTTICDDGAEVDVSSYVALDERLDEEGEMKYKYMKALWMDNDKYYSMITEDLVTREDFLQEVNRVIISNHVPFDEIASTSEIKP